MRHNYVSRRLGVKTGHRTAMLRNLSRGLVRDGSIRTTKARAMVLRSYLEKLVTKLKDPSVPNIRYALSILNDRETVQSLARDIAPKFKTRQGGYLRILKMAKTRPGDNAEMAVIQWVDEELVAQGYEKRFLIEKVTVGKKKKASGAKKEKGSKEDDKPSKTKKPAKSSSVKSSGKKSS